MTGPGAQDPRGPVGGGGYRRVISLGARGRTALAIALLLGGAAALLLGATLLVALVAVGVVVATVGAIWIRLRRLVRGREGERATPRVGRPDPSMEVFPDRSARDMRDARGSLTEGDHDGDA